MKAILIDQANDIEYPINNHLTIGRSSRNDIIIDTTIISRRHCQIVFNKNKFILEDLKSLNGTYLNGKKISQAHILHNQDVISLGQKGNSFKLLILSTEQKEPQNRHFPTDLLLKTNKKLLATVLIIIIGLLVGSSLIVRLTTQKRSQAMEKKEYDVIEAKLHEILDRYGENKITLDDEIIQQIKKYIHQYKNSQTLEEGLKRRSKYIQMIEKIFVQYKIPKDLSYIAFVESQYDPVAYNRYSGARGMWQLMPATARQYGLVVNRKRDDRIHPEKSTIAAAKYTNDLISIFGIHSFTIALAAYNVGDGYLRQTLRQIKDPVNDRNFWYLYKNNMLPNETKEYVLKILALIILCESTQQVPQVTLTKERK